jgi:hypothetical protein
MLNDSLIDKRIVERNIKKGRVDTAEYQQTLAALPDLSGRVWRHEDRPAPQVHAPAAAAAPAVPAAPAAQPAAPAMDAGADEGWGSESDEDDEDDETTEPTQPSPFG